MIVGAAFIVAYLVQLRDTLLCARPSGVSNVVLVHYQSSISTTMTMTIPASLRCDRMRRDAKVSRHDGLPRGIDGLGPRVADGAGLLLGGLPWPGSFFFVVYVTSCSSFCFLSRLIW